MLDSGEIGIDASNKKRERKHDRIKNWESQSGKIWKNRESQSGKIWKNKLKRNVLILE